MSALVRATARRTLVALAFVAVLPAFQQGGAGAQPDAGATAGWQPALRWRSIGPWRGGRVTAVAGVASQPHVYYFGATGGGVWKTTDSGTTWAPVSDGVFRTGSIGAIDVASSKPDVIYVGTGEACVRSNFAEGDGVYRSIDAGRTWTHVGLDRTHQIGRIRVDPRNPDVAWVAALGNVFGGSEDRGVYKTTDGGQAWQRVLFVDDQTGAADLAIDPSAPDTAYATFWHVRRKPWGLFSGGPGSGLHKTTDGGKTWRRLTNGLPAGVTGRIGVSVSPVNPRLVWAIVEAHDGGIFRSDDGGDTWRRTNDESRLRERSWYYSHIYADTQDADTVYVLTLQIYRSSDGGKTFETIRPRHVDNHDLWIDPGNNQRMVNGNDGGAHVTVNGGATWSTQDNQATAQFYRVTTDTRFPYRVYGAQQDNSTVSIASRSSGPGISERDWHPVGGGESGWIAPDPRNPDIVYAGSYYGLLTRYDHGTGESRNITVWPVSPGGRPAAEMKYRFQWNFPIVASRHEPAVYAAANVLFRTSDEGQSWQAISGDLTRNDRSTQGPVGGPITGDNSSADYYGTIFTVAESPVQAGVIWTGSDDGLINVTRNRGTSWQNVTPPALPAFSRVNSIDASPHDAGTAHAAVTRYQSDDRKPYVYRTTDFGATWQVLGSGIPDGAFVRVVREDPMRKGLLYAGTERGVFVSFDSGAAWTSLQLNLPAVPITDLAVQQGDLVAATQGRAFWILDDLTVLRRWSGAAPTTATLFPPAATHRVRGPGGPGRPAEGLGENPPGGVVTYFSLPEEPAQEVTLEYAEAGGAVIRRVSLRAAGGQEGGGTARAGAPAARHGLNRYVWDMRYPDAASQPEGTILFGASTRGPLAPPGKYEVRLTAGGATVAQPFEVRRDPRLPASDQDLRDQFTLLMQIRDRVTAAHDAARSILRMQAALKPIVAGGDATLAPPAAALEKTLDAVLLDLVDMRMSSGNDVLSYPIRLANRIATIGSVVGSSDRRPTDQARAAFAELDAELTGVLDRLKTARDTDLAALNRRLTKAGRPAIPASP